MTLPTPLSIILEEMHRKYALEDKEGAVALARLAAPYIHGRVRPSEAAAELSKLSDADLDKLSGAGGEATPSQSQTESDGLGGVGAGAAEPEAGITPSTTDT